MIQEFQIFSVWFQKARWLHLLSDPHVRLIEVGEVVQRLGRGFTEAVFQRTVQIREDFSYCLVKVKHGLPGKLRPFLY